MRYYNYYHHHYPITATFTLVFWGLTICRRRGGPLVGWQLARFDRHGRWIDLVIMIVWEGVMSVGEVMCVCVMRWQGVRRRVM